MHELALNTLKRFRNLLDEIAAESGELGLAGASNRMAVDNADLGPSVGDDQAPSPRNVTLLGPSVGDDLGAPAVRDVTLLGPSVGDDTGASDLRLKQDVRRIGSTVFGLPLYHFQYRGRSETYEGVMAQDVLQVMPGAVSLAADGYYRVDYRALGTSMRRVS